MMESWSYVTEEGTLLNFAVDLAVVILAKYREDMEAHVSEIFHTINSWLRIVKLSIADENASLTIVGKMILLTFGLIATRSSKKR